MRFLATPRWIALEVAVVAFVLACYFLLAPWQFSRSDQHNSQMAEIARAVAAPPADVSTLLTTTSQPGIGLTYRTARATGHFDATGEALIRLRQDADGNPAYEVVVPFVTSSGTVLVDRGYVSYQSVQQNSAPIPALPSGTVTVEGRVQPDQTDPKNRGPVVVPDGHTAYTAASSVIVSASSGSTVYRGYLQLVDGSTGVIEAIPLPQPDDARPFFEYAIQWLIFGAIAVLGLGYFIYREYRDPVEGEIYLTGPDDAESGAPDPDGRAPGDPAAPRMTTDTAAREGASRARKRFDKSQLYDD